FSLYYSYGDHLDLHSFPTRRSSDLIHRDICYREGSADEKHRLDLFLPHGTNWPILIFIHGGGLTSGDKALRVSGADVYGNIGRLDRKSTRLNSSHVAISYAVFCLKK